MRPAGVYPFSIGKFECCAISDLSDEHPLTLPATLYSQQPEEEVIGFLQERYAAVYTTPAQNTVLYFKMPSGEEGLIDTGAGRFSPDGGPYEGAVRRHLKAVGISPERIERILFTHFHLDHFGGAFGPHDELVYPNALYSLSRQEVEYWLSTPDLGGMRVDDDFRGLLVGTAQQYLPLLTGKLIPFEAHQEVLPGIRASPAPGHTPYHQAFLMESEGQTLLVVGDAFVHHLITPAHPEWECDLDVNATQAVETRKALLDYAASTGCLVLAYHYAWGQGLGHVRRQTQEEGQGYAWEPGEYQW